MADNNTFQTTSPNVAPAQGWWGERNVTWLCFKSNFSTIWAEPFSTLGGVGGSLLTLEQYGTVLGLYSDEGKNIDLDAGTAGLDAIDSDFVGIGRNLYVAFGYAGGDFAVGAYAETIKSGTESAPVYTTTGTDDVLQAISLELAKHVDDSYAADNNGIYIAACNGFVTIPQSDTPPPTFDMIGGTDADRVPGYTP